MNATAKIIGVSTQTVMRWIRKMYDKFITCTPNIDNVQEVQNGKLLIIDIGWAFGHRDR